MGPVPASRPGYRQHHGAPVRDFRRLLLQDPEFRNQLDFTRWADLKEKLTAVFKTKTRQEWCDVMEGTDACFAPVLSMSEAPRHPHNRQRKTFTEIQGVLQPSPAPRFSRTIPRIKNPPPDPGRDTEAVLRDFGFSADEISALRTVKAID